jgi:hypothetical protein
MEVNIQPSLNSFADTGLDFGALGYPYLDGAFRFGVDESLDVGVALRGFLVASVDVRWAFVNTEHLTLSVCPSLGLGWALLGQVDFHLLVDVKFNDAFKLTGSLKAFSLVPFVDPEEVLSFVGASAGFEIALGDGLHWAPILTMALPVTGDMQSRELFLTLGMGFKFRKLSGF